jgi:hypothetical protein
VSTPDPIGELKDQQISKRKNAMMHEAKPLLENFMSYFLKRVERTILNLPISRKRIEMLLSRWLLIAR